MSDRSIGALILGAPLGTGTYAHNIFVELIYQYGLVIGVAMFSLFVIIVLKPVPGVLRHKDDDIAILVITFIPVGFVSLAFSGSYLTSFFFWSLMGLMVGINRKWKEESVLRADDAD